MLWSAFCDETPQPARLAWALLTGNRCKGNGRSEPPAIGRLPLRHFLTRCTCWPKSAEDAPDVSPARKRWVNGKTNQSARGATHSPPARLSTAAACRKPTRIIPATPLFPRVYLTSE